MPFTYAAIEVWARANAEVLTYAVFLVLFALMGLLELILTRSRAPARRVRRWSTNVVLTTLWVLSGPIVPLSLLGASDLAQANGWGLLNWLGIAAPLAFAAGILGRSLISYATHLAMHKVPLLWRIHRVHHLDSQMDISTTARFHPLEALATAPFAIAGVIALGVPPLAILLYEVLDATMVVITHANIRLPRGLDRALSLILVTPDMHRVHHSADQAETDSNYGATLSVWDRLFGTYRRKGERELAELPLGLGEVRDARAQSILWLLASPFLSLRRPSREPIAHAEQGERALTRHNRHSSLFLAIGRGQRRHDRRSRPHRLAARGTGASRRIRAANCAADRPRKGRQAAVDPGAGRSIA